MSELWHAALADDTVVTKLAPDSVSLADALQAHNLNLALEIKRALRLGMGRDHQGAFQHFSRWDPFRNIAIETFATEIPGYGFQGERIGFTREIHGPAGWHAETLPSIMEFPAFLARSHWAAPIQDSIQIKIVGGEHKRFDEPLRTLTSTVIGLTHRYKSNEPDDRLRFVLRLHRETSPKKFLSLKEDSKLFGAVGQRA